MAPDQGHFHRPSAGRGSRSLTYALAVALITGCNSQDSTSYCSAGATEIHGAFWPGRLDSESVADAGRGDLLSKARKLRASSKASSSWRRSLELARLGAATGDLDLSVRATRDAAKIAPQENAVLSHVAAALLARYNILANPDDLLDAAEILAGRADDDPAMRCNRVRAFGKLGLAYRVKSLIGECPCDCPKERSIAADPTLDGKRHPVDVLLATDITQVVELLAGNDRRAASRLIRQRSAGWRVYFEREALIEWTRQADQTASRRELETRMLSLTDAYRDATSNPAPRRAWEQVAGLSSGQVTAVKNGISAWIAGAQQVRNFEPAAALTQLDKARLVFVSQVPELLPAVDLARATARYHLGDDQAMRIEARAVRQGTDPQSSPWTWARALWLEASALLADADWEAALQSSSESARLYSAIGEEGSAGFVDTIAALALDFMKDDQAAQIAHLSAIRRTNAGGDQRLLAGALQHFSRQQGRLDRPNLAVELQTESALLNSRESLPLSADATAVLAEQLLRARRTTEAQQQLNDARALAARIESRVPRQRTLAFLALTEARGLTGAQAEAAFTQVLATYGGFGERSFRTEALLGRARVRSSMGKVDQAKADFTAALEEITAQGARLRDRARSVAVIDEAREALEHLVGVLLASDTSGAQALQAIENARESQLLGGFGGQRATPAAGRPSPLPAGTCVTEYFSRPEELLAWTTCDAAGPSLDRIPIARHALRELFTDFRLAAIAGDLERLRATSQSLATWLLEPLRKSLSASVSWIVIPDATLPAIPYAWLQLDEQFLFQSRAVMTAVSPTLFTRSAEAHVDQIRIAAFGDPAAGPDAVAADVPRLVFAAREATSLAQRFPGSLVRLGPTATWSGFAEAANSFAFVHFAGHISPGSRVPLGARMRFAPEPARPDGRVAADEVSNARFQDLRLVVLAACASGEGASTKLAGSLDFSKAFLHAGAAQVLGTLWEVPDRESAEVFSQFYDGIGAGATPEAALRKIWSQGFKSNQPRAVISTLAALQLTTSTANAQPRGSNDD